MARIITISIKDEDSWLVDAAKSHGGISHVFTEGAKYILKEQNIIEKPYWFVEGKDYSYLTIKERIQLEAFGYSELCSNCRAPAGIGELCDFCTIAVRVL